MENRRGACGHMRIEMVPAPGALPANYTVYLADDESVRAKVSCYGAALALRLAAQKEPRLMPAYRSCPTARNREVSQFWGEIQSWNEPEIHWFD